VRETIRFLSALAVARKSSCHFVAPAPRPIVRHLSQFTVIPKTLVVNASSTRCPHPGKNAHRQGLRTSRVENLFAELSISDRGPGGIPAERLKMFQPFGLSPQGGRDGHSRSFHFARTLVERTRSDIRGYAPEAPALSSRLDCRSLATPTTAFPLKLGARLTGIPAAAHSRPVFTATRATARMNRIFRLRVQTRQIPESISTLSSSVRPSLSTGAPISASAILAFGWPSPALPAFCLVQRAN